MARKKTEVIKEIDAVIEEAEKEKKAEEEKKKKDETKYGKRVHVMQERHIIHCRGTFVTEYLGSLPGSKQIYTDYIASKAPDAMTMAQEIELYGQEDVENNKRTKIPRDADGDLCILDYQVRGFLKNAAEALKRAGILNVTAYVKNLSQLVFISGSEEFTPALKTIKLIKPEKAAISLNERPLMANTPKGQRVGIASSESLPPGTTFEFYLSLLNKKFEPAVLSWLEYSWFSGLGQWRTAGHGRFRVDIERKGKWIPVEEA